MLSKIVLVLSCLYAVQAVFVVEPPLGGVDTIDELNGSSRSCGAYECNQHCKKMGYARGVCIGTYCQCRLRMALLRPHLLEDVVESINDALQPSPELPKNDPENKDVSADDSDEDLAVDFSIKSTPVENALGRAARACSNSNCNRFCRSRGYARGICISSRVCRCYRYRVTLRDEEESQNEGITSNDVGEDIPSAADDSDDFKTKDDDSTEAVGRSARVCINSSCDQFCRSRGYAWGHCVGINICRCYRTRRSSDVSEGDIYGDTNEGNLNDDNVKADEQEETEQSTDESSSSKLASVRACYKDICVKNCRALRYDTGICVISRCQCLGRPIWSKVAAYEIENEVQEDDSANDINAGLLEQESVSKTAPAVRSCSPRSCDQSCRRIGFPGGACVNGRCKCDLLRRELPAPIPAPEQNLQSSVQASKCMDYQCAETCRRMHYRGGLCNANSCICFN